MIRVNYHLTEQQLEGLKRESTRTGLSVAELIRGAVDTRLARPRSLQTLGELTDQINGAFNKIDSGDTERQRIFLEKLGMSTRLFRTLVRTRFLRRHCQEILILPIDLVPPQLLVERVQGFGPAAAKDFAKWVKRFLRDEAKID